jgi:hypothetical protein
MEVLQRHTPGARWLHGPYRRSPPPLQRDVHFAVSLDDAVDRMNKEQVLSALRRLADERNAT